MATEREITPALLREAAVKDICEALGICVSDEGTVELREFLRAVADAWEGGWMEWPVSADGRAVHIGEKVFVGSEGPYEVVGLYLGHCGGWEVRYETTDGTCMVSVGCVTHDAPDSWARIVLAAFALGGWSVEMVGDGPGYTIGDLVERCRRLAGES